MTEQSPRKVELERAWFRDGNYRAGDKRQYMPYLLRWTCPQGHDNVWDMRDEYLSYPEVGKVEDHFVCCNEEGCGYEGTVKLKFDLSLEVVS